MTEKNCEHFLTMALMISCNRKMAHSTEALWVDMARPRTDDSASTECRQKTRVPSPFVKVALMARNWVSYQKVGTVKNTRVKAIETVSRMFPVYASNSYK